VSDPRPSNPTGQTYSVDCLGNVVGGRKTIYNNQVIFFLLRAFSEDEISAAIKESKDIILAHRSSD
jgi:aminopeptidase C